MNAHHAILFNQTGLRLHAGVAEPDFAQTPEAARAAVHYAAGTTSFELGECVLNGLAFHARIVFARRALHRVELCLRLPSDAAGWAGWSLETELQRKQAHEAWAHRALGVELAPRLGPPPDDQGPRPATRDPRESPRHGGFPGGEVASLYDDRSACARLVIRYDAAT